MALKQCRPKEQECGEDVGSEIQDLCAVLYLGIDANLGAFRMEPREEVGVHDHTTIHCSLREQEMTSPAYRQWMDDWVEPVYPGGATSTQEAEDIKKVLAEIAFRDKAIAPRPDAPLVSASANPHSSGSLTGNCSVPVADLLKRKQARGQRVPG